jgi:hypothetical protein
MKRRFVVMMLVVAMGCGIFPVHAVEEEKEPVIAGITIERKSTEGFLGIEITSNNFKLTFYDKDKKPVRADFGRALLRWDVTYKKAQERLILTAEGDGTYLTSPRVIRPPFNFQLFITLIADGKDDESETYVIRFRQ